MSDVDLGWFFEPQNAFKESQQGTLEQRLNSLPKAVTIWDNRVGDFSWEFAGLTAPMADISINMC